MKKALLALAFLAIFQPLKAQITLEHSYGVNTHVSAVKLEVEGYKYWGLDSAKTSLLFYNLNHSLWKSIPIPTVSGFYVYNVGSLISEHLFNSDNSIEYVITYYSKISSNASFENIVNESGTVVATLTDAYSVKAVNVGTGWKLITDNVNSGGYGYSSVYSVPGVYIGTLKAPTIGGSSSTDFMAPNPVETSAVLHYSLPVGVNQGTVGIYDMSGALVRNYQVTNQFSELLIDRGSLPSGVYTFRISAPGYQSLSERFVVE